jgi:predicted dehydrogenase
MPPIKIALLGAGIFARDDHLPALLALAEQFEIGAIYSRSLEKAAALAARLPNPPAIYADLPTVLARPDLQAVDIVLPIPLQPAVVEAALRAGKHVISEKPVAPTVAEGRQLLRTAAGLTGPSGLVWMVAENLRYVASYQAAAQVIRQGQIGRPIQASWAICNVINPQVKYYHTAWRRDNSFPGGFVLDGGVHSIAVIRQVMGEVESAAAFGRQVRPDLPPVDTLSANLRFESGAFGVFSITFAGTSEFASDLHVFGDRGSLRVNPSRLEVTVDEVTTTRAFASNGVQAELADFASAIRSGITPASPPLEALRDVALIEAMLESARTGAIVHPQRLLD